MEFHHQTLINRSILIIPLLIPPLIISVIQPIPVLTNLVPKPLDAPDLLAGPARDILRRILYVLHAVVPLPLDVVAKPIEALLHIVAEAIKALLRLVGKPLRLANATSRPLRRVFGQVFGVAFEARFVGVPVVLCEVVVLVHSKKKKKNFTRDAPSRERLTHLLPLMHGESPRRHADRSAS